MEIMKRQGTITSLELLEQINLFRAQIDGKAELQHKNLLQVIRDEFSEEIGCAEILATPYIHPQNGQTYEMFILTISQAKQVLVRESKSVRKAVIKRLEELETPRELTRMEILEIAMENEKEKMRLQQLIEIQAPKVEFHDKVLSSQSTFSITQIAKELGMTAQKLNQWLYEKGIQFKQGGQWMLYAKYQDKGYTDTTTTVIVKDNGEVSTKHLTKWTEKGRKMIHELFAQELHQN